MEIDVSPTRMEMLKLKKRLNVARRGHKLLKDKLEELIQRMLELVRSIRELREGVNSGLAAANTLMASARGKQFPGSVETALSASNRQVDISISQKRILSLTVPVFTIETRGRLYEYGFTQTSVNLDDAVKSFDEILEKIIALAEKEKTIELMAEEILKTRRRVNALEYVLIPSIETTIRYISMKLDEQERNTQMQLMRIKDIIRAPRSQVSAYPGKTPFPRQDPGK